MSEAPCSAQAQGSGSTCAEGVFKPAIKNSASKIILVYNHPSRDAEPSEDDKILTKNLRSVGNELGINLVDHVIISNNEFKGLGND